MSGEVVIEATVTRDGAIEQLTVVKGHPLLIPAALGYAKHCRHTPLKDSHEAAEAIENISLHFRYVGKTAIPVAPVRGSGP